MFDSIVCVTSGESDPEATIALRSDARTKDAKNLSKGLQLQALASEKRCGVPSDTVAYDHPSIRF
jgi:hypothetical protein